MQCSRRRQCCCCLPACCCCGVARLDRLLRPHWRKGRRRRARIEEGALYKLSGLADEAADEGTVDELEDGRDPEEDRKVVLVAGHFLAVGFREASDMKNSMGP